MTAIVVVILALDILLGVFIAWGITEMTDKVGRGIFATIVITLLLNALLILRLFFK